ncbi:FecR family protein [Chitinophaga polysaccharea]|uniref:FecR family protein n=1 Tax=Chitinophaga polysaccharea TaxID=1293035 RepID=A0A561PPF8_9BACT|nr:FecR family protein [Chitinophaga polysaccharea]TWF39988.1 FecR family protein [Chitinophaga polysaccharea]
MQQERLQFLFDRYVSREASNAEERELMEMVVAPANKGLLMNILRTYMHDELPLSLPSDTAEETLLAFIREERKGPQGGVVRMRWWMIAAASIIVLLATFLLSQSRRHTAVVTRHELAAADVPAGHSGAVLTLGNGQVIQLDAAGNGALAAQGKVTISKSADVVSYKLSGHESGPVVYNTLSTPRGRHMSMVLADGTQVWLNAASSIRFPSAFTNGTRHVEVTGEVYFEVAKVFSPDGKHRLPFTVAAGNTSIEVLGTHFNVNAYTDEPTVSTTLLEGAVKVRKERQEVGLLPGQQSVLGQDGHLTVNTHVNTAEIMAWKEGYFHFESTTLAAALRQFSRWYDVDIVFEGKLPEDKIFAIIKRSNSLSTVLKALQTTNTHFKIDKELTTGAGKKLIISMN